MQKSGEGVGKMGGGGGIHGLTLNRLISHYASRRMNRRAPQRIDRHAGEIRNNEYAYFCSLHYFFDATVIHKREVSFFCPF